MKPASASSRGCHHAGEPLARLRAVQEVLLKHPPNDGLEGRLAALDRVPGGRQGGMDGLANLHS
jgi:hypothetical protein